MDFLRLGPAVQALSVECAGLGDLQSSHLSLLRYKKNLKALYVVHPTSFIKALWSIFKPLIR